MIRIIFVILALVFVQLVNGQLDACQTAVLDLTTDATCSDALAGNDTNTICEDPCRSLYDAIINNCNETISASLSEAISFICDGGVGDACTTAQLNLSANDACLNALGGDDLDAICAETCLTLYTAIALSCDPSTAGNASTLVDFCNSGTTAECVTALNAANESCLTYLSFANPALCSGTCNTQASAIATACADSTDLDVGDLVSAYDTACNSDAQCTAALVALNADDDCINALTNDDTTTSCTGSCADLVNAALNTCPNNTFVAGSRIDYNEDCAAACRFAAYVIDDSCVTYLYTANPAVCSGTCNTQVSEAAAICADSTDSEIQELVAAYNTACNSDVDCQAAFQALNADADCITALDNNDTETYCSGSCADLIRDALDTCPDNAFIESRTRSYFQDCGTPCQMAFFSIDESCLTYLDTANPHVCSGTCNTQVSAAVTTCATDSDGQVFVAAYNTACNSGDQCTAALVALNADDDCITAISNDDTATSCSGSCADLINAALNTCPNNSFIASSRADYDQDCALACQAAGEAIDESCLTYLNTANSAVCSGTCNTQVSAAADVCADSTDSDIQEFVAAYNTACNSDVQCTAAFEALNANAGCITALNNNDTDTYCLGTCADLIRDALSACPDNAFIVSRTRSYFQDCGTSCQMAFFSIDQSCLTYLGTANPHVCSGTCNTQLSEVVTTCATDSSSQVFVAAYNTACNSDAQCQAALVALNADDDCITALNSDDTTTYCSGSCANLVNAVYDVCPENAFLSRSEYNEECGIEPATKTPSGSVIIQASGIITLLLAAMCALLF